MADKPKVTETTEEKARFIFEACVRIDNCWDWYLSDPDLLAEEITDIQGAAERLLSD